MGNSIGYFASVKGFAKGVEKLFSPHFSGNGGQAW